MFCLKSFLINKIPTLLTALAGSMFEPLTPEFCISDALQHVDLNAFPSFALGMISDSPLQDVRQEFIYACILHGLLPVGSVERLLGETPFNPPPSQETRYHKDILVQRCVTEPGKAAQLVDELEKLDGNGGAIVVALTQVSPAPQVLVHMMLMLNEGHSRFLQSERHYGSQANMQCSF
jgi:mediator of RNA polymerase II transcription subunit 5